jgi:hypothetical protein
MKGYSIKIEEETLANTNFLKVLYTGKHSQLVLMNLLPHEEIDRKTLPVYIRMKSLKNRMQVLKRN